MGHQIDVYIELETQDRSLAALKGIAAKQSHGGDVLQGLDRLGRGHRAPWAPN